jgi:oligoribonuclease NrnB/cAMP/cGMP phosphodiesterase (DHH superfamily)
MICLYHNDMDGRCAAALVRAYRKNDPDDLYVEMNYDHPDYPFALMPPDESTQVVIVDFSITPESMARLLESGAQVTWIDHHKTALDKYPKDLVIPGLRHVGFSGAILTWVYLFSRKRCEAGILRFDDEAMKALCREAPLFIQLVDDWDCWKFRYDTATREFQMSMGGKLLSNSTWDSFIREELTEIPETYDFDAAISRLENHGIWSFTPREYSSSLRYALAQGRATLSYRIEWSTAYCKRYGFEARLPGFPDVRIYAMNLGQANSEYFHDVPEGIQARCLFSFNGKRWFYSIYSDQIDVTPIAKSFGGGGHAGASGFDTETLVIQPVTE